MINFVIVTHGEFGAYLIEAAEEILGEQREGVRAVALSSRSSVEEARRRVAQAIRELKSPEGLVVATDMPGGTPSNIVLALAKDRPDIDVVSGLNLYMLVSAFSRRATDSRREVVRRMLEDGQKAIQDVKAKLLTHCPAGT